MHPPHARVGCIVLVHHIDDTIHIGAYTDPVQQYPRYRHFVQIHISEATTQVWTVVSALRLRFHAHCIDFEKHLFAQLSFSTVCAALEDFDLTSGKLKKY